MKEDIQLKIGIGVAVSAFVLAIIQFLNACIILQGDIIASLMEPSVIYVFLTAIIVLLTAIIRNRLTRFIQVVAAFATGYGTSLGVTSGDLTYLIFLGLGAALALEYGFLNRHFTTKTCIMTGVLLCTLVYGMLVLNNLSVLTIIHSIIGACTIIFLFYVLTKIRIRRFTEHTELLEEQVAERTRDLEEEMGRVKNLSKELQTSIDEKKHLLEEKDILLKELLHRTKNSMQLISSFLSLERNNINDPSASKVLEKSMNRITALALAQEQLYSSDSLTEINLKDYLETLIKAISDELFRLNLTCETVIPEDIPTDIDFAIRLGFILNELLTNSYAHAFPGNREGRVLIQATLSNNILTLSFKDNGVGLPADIDPEHPKTLGLQLILQLLDQYNGTYTLRREGGTEWNLTIPFLLGEEPSR